MGNAVIAAEGCSIMLDGTHHRHVVCACGHEFHAAVEVPDSGEPPPEHHGAAHARALAAHAEHARACDWDTPPRPDKSPTTLDPESGRHVPRPGGDPLCGARGTTPRNDGTVTKV